MSKEVIALEGLSCSEVDALILEGKVSRKKVADHYEIPYQMFLRYWNKTASLEKVIELDETATFRNGNQVQFWTIGNVTGTANGWAKVFGCNANTFRKTVKLYPPGSKAIYKHVFKGSTVWGGNEEWTRLKDTERNLHLLDGPGKWEIQWI